MTLARTDRGAVTDRSTTSLPADWSSERTYRRDIDGLRAVAIIPVVLFHAAIPGFSGGFIGVDIFFVISGFLITQVLIGDFSEQKLPVVRFYERRIRRIFPALVVVVIFCIALSAVFLLPAYFRSFSISVVATGAFLANFWFWTQGGYFEPQHQYIPLFHTWSLGVEEQFYIVYPLLLWISLRYAARHVTSLLALVFLASLVASQFVSARFAFYLTPFRAWELALGCLVAVDAFPSIKHAAVRQLLAVAGLLLIVASVMCFTPETHVTGFLALLPCSGAAMLIYAGGSGPTWANGLLTATPLRFMGLISYSLYLWHWPLLIFGRLALLRPLSGIETVAAIALSILAATASWAFVERPFRKPNGVFSRRALFAAAGGTVVALLCVGLTGFLANGWPQRWSRPALAMANYLTYMHTEERKTAWREDSCYMPSPDFSLSGYRAMPCLQPSDSAKNVLLWGDSTAAQFAGALDRLLSTRGYHLMQATAAGCLPLVAPKLAATPSCEALNDLVLRKLQNLPVDVVVLSGFWYAAREVGALAPDLEKTLGSIQARHIPVLMIGPPIEYDEPLPVLLAMQISRYGRVPIHLSQFIRPGLLDFDRELRQSLDGRSGVAYLSTFDHVCQNDLCPTTLGDGTPLQFDAAHLTAPGALYVASKIFKKLPDMISVDGLANPANPDRHH